MSGLHSERGNEAIKRWYWEAPSGEPFRTYSCKFVIRTVSNVQAFARLLIGRLMVMIEKTP